MPSELFRKFESGCGVTAWGCKSKLLVELYCRQCYSAYHPTLKTRNNRMTTKLSMYLYNFITTQSLGSIPNITDINITILGI